MSKKVNYIPKINAILDYLYMLSDKKIYKKVKHIIEYEYNNQEG